MYQQKLEKQLQISLPAGILYKVSNRSLDPFLQTSVYRKSSQSDRGNYYPVIILPNTSKVSERGVYKQNSTFFNKILSKFQRSVRKDMVLNMLNSTS